MVYEEEYCANPVAGTWTNNADAWDGDAGDAASTLTDTAQTSGNITGNVFSDMGDSDSILGIEVDVVADGDGGDTCTVELYHVTDAGYTSTTYAFAPGAKNTYTVGGASTLWGKTWNPANDIKQATFGVRLQYAPVGKANTMNVYSVLIRVTYAAPAAACEVYAAEAILDYEVNPAEVYAAEAILDYEVNPAEVYAAEAILDYEVPPAEVYAAEAILDYEVAETTPCEVYAAEAILDYEVNPAEVYAAEAILDYEVNPAEVYAAEAILDYEVNPAEVYAAEAILDYTAAAQPAEVYAAEAVLDYEREVATGGGSPGAYRWPMYYQPPEPEVEEPPVPRLITTVDEVEIEDFESLTRAMSDSEDELVVVDTCLSCQMLDTDEVVLEDDERANMTMTANDSVAIEDLATMTSSTTMTEMFQSPAFKELFHGMIPAMSVSRMRPLTPAESERSLGGSPRPSRLARRIGRIRDPSKTGKIRYDYAASMDKLFVSFKRDMAKLLGVRKLEDEYAPDMATILSELDETIEITILIPAKDETGKYTTRAYTAGGMRGTQFLNALNPKVNFVMVPADKYALDVLKARNLSALKGISDEMSKEIMRIITDGVTRGDGPMVIAREIDRSIDSIGRTRANMMARTETMKAYNTGAKTQFKKHGITEVEWLANGPNMCGECEALNARTFPIDGAPECPLHPNCVCALLPVIPEID